MPEWHVPPPKKHRDKPEFLMLWDQYKAILGTSVRVVTPSGDNIEVTVIGLEPHCARDGSHKTVTVITCPELAGKIWGSGDTLQWTGTDDAPRADVELLEMYVYWLRKELQ